MKSSGNSLFREIVAALFVLLFLYTGIEKLTDRSRFESAMEHSDLIHPFARLLSWSIPMLELIIVLLLFLPRLRRIGLISSTILLALFTAYIVYILKFYEQLPCRCGGVIEQMTWKEHLLFNLFFLFMGMVSIIPSNKLNRLIAINRRSRIPV